MGMREALQAMIEPRKPDDPMYQRLDQYVDALVKQQLGLKFEDRSRESFWIESPNDIGYQFKVPEPGLNQNSQIQVELGMGLEKGIEYSYDTPHENNTDSFKDQVDKARQRVAVFYGVLEHLEGIGYTAGEDSKISDGIFHAKFNIGTDTEEAIQKVFSDFLSAPNSE